MGNWNTYYTMYRRIRLTWRPYLLTPFDDRGWTNHAIPSDSQQPDKKEKKEKTPDEL